MTQGADRQYFVFVIPVERELDLKKAARAVGEKNVEMVRVKDLNQVTGYIRGGCSPIGMKKAYGTVVDGSCGALREMLVSAGKIEMCIRDSIYVMCNGEIKACLDKDELEQNTILKYALGV